MPAEGNYKQSEKKALTMWENNSIWKNWQMINLQNIQVAHATQYKKQNNSIKKMVETPKQTFLQGRHRDSQQIHEKMLNIAHY